MNDELRTLLRDLYDEGQQYDATQADRTCRRRNLAPDSAELLWFLVQAVRAQFVLEIGTSNGYSTLWLADAVRITRGRVLSVDINADAQREASRWLHRSGLNKLAELRVADGGEVLRELPAGTVDLLFLDADHASYVKWWNDIFVALRPAGLIVVDNAVSHAAEIAPLHTLLVSDPTMTVTQLNVGKGVLLAVRSM